MSRKFQITLPDDLAAELKREAARLQIPIAEFIRQTMRGKLAKRPPSVDGHPFESILGIVEAGEPDLSDRVDEILYR